MLGKVKAAAAPLWRRLPEGVRARLVDAKLGAREIVRRRGVDVPIDRIHLGGTRGHSAAAFGAGVGDPDWTTTRVTEGPHADLYRRFAAGEAEETDWRDPSIPYVRLALACIDGFGEFCGCTDLDDVVGLIAHRRALWDRDDESSTPIVVGPAVVRPIRGTDRYEVVDGHHRLSRAWQRGATRALVDVTWSTSPATGSGPPGGRG